MRKKTYHTMKKPFLLLVFAFTIWSLYGQVTDGEKQIKTQTVDTLMGWKNGGIVNINTSQTSLTNWAAGGQSSVSISGLLSLYANNKREKGLWETYLDLGYGVMNQKKAEWWKSDDRIDFTSKYGLKASDKFYYAGLVNFKTQFADGFNYPNDSVKISGFMAPGYLLTAIGIDYIPNPSFTLFFAPVTAKFTFVMDDNLANAGAFGVDPGDHIKTELGGYLRVFYKKDLMENVSLQTKLDLFSNYLKDFGNIDVSWETLISMKVNKLISTTLTTHLLYDDDVVITREKEDGSIKAYKSKVQFKEVLAVGLSVKF
jgi:hypothetical protein